jgi:hypothetical protein
MLAACPSVEKTILPSPDLRHTAAFIIAPQVNLLGHSTDMIVAYVSANMWTNQKNQAKEKKVKLSP